MTTVEQTNELLLICRFAKQYTQANEVRAHLMRCIAPYSCSRELLRV
jgi:hypothetical protein